MIYLLDTNVWLERLLDQDRAAEVAAFFEAVPAENICISDFTVHSIGVILTRLKHPEAFLLFVQDVLIDSGVAFISVNSGSLRRVVEATTALGLDFDDAYQYAAAELYEATIISFDGDFDSTPLGRRTPAEVTSMA
jgi:predicted nucleic acid-binding protein